MNEFSLYMFFFGVFLISTVIYRIYNSSSLEFSNSKIFKKIILLSLLLSEIGFAKDLLVVKNLSNESITNQELFLKEDETINYINKYNFDTLQCNVGSIFSDETLSSIGFVEIPNYKIYTRIKLPNVDFFQNRITHCAIFNDNIYVLEQVDTQRPSTVNQTLLYVCKIGEKSQKCKQIGIDFFTSYVEIDKDNFIIDNHNIVIHGKSRKKNILDDINDKDFEILLKVFW